jgi:hypothetical protein
MLLTLCALALFCFALERAFPGWPLPQVKTWPLRVVLVNLGDDLWVKLVPPPIVDLIKADRLFGYRQGQIRQ